ncbi:hypothetical protein [Nocardia sp. XZ_19_385]|uniref:hypothetical protein n=1 Tax=Nocardia sp. XZ_19_385 TaxID=2769488 RepID=UPI0018906695|nr:hypothetical protein [Nocardia sp. XZ_19_385]
MINLRGARWMAGIAAGALLLAGCSESKSQGSTAAPSTPREQLLLTQDEFPAGAKKVDVPKDKLEAAAADMTGLQDTATLTPAECAATTKDLSTASKALLADSAVAAATDAKSGVMYIEFVAGRTGDLQAIAEGNKRCGDLTVTSSVEGKQISTVAKAENLSAPADLKGIDAIAFRTTTISTVGAGKPLTSVGYQGMAVLRGTTVVVRASALKDSLDEAAFQKLFVDAVRKIETAS